MEKSKNMKDGQKDITETLQLREAISVMNVEENSFKTQASLVIKESTLERHPIHVMYVAKLSEFTNYRPSVNTQPIKTISM